MTNKEILLDFMVRLREDVYWVLNDIQPETLCWSPDEEANNIAVTVWHFSRAFDVFKTRLFENAPPEAEIWHTREWASKTGYYPWGIGWGGFGNLAGYTLAEVADIPILSADELFEYFDQVYEVMYQYLDSLPNDELYQLAIGYQEKQRTIYEWLKNLLVDSQEHLGEIKAIRAMW